MPPGFAPAAGGAAAGPPALAPGMPPGFPLFVGIDGPLYVGMLAGPPELPMLAGPAIRPPGISAPNPPIRSLAGP